MSTSNDQEGDQPLTSTPCEESVTAYNQLQLRCNCLQGCTWLKRLQTLGCYGSYFVIGILVSMISVTLVELEENTQSSTAQIAFLYTWLYIGRLPAVLLCGFIFDKINRNLQLGCALLLLGLSGAFIPLCSNYYFLSLLVALAGAATGFLGTGCTSTIISLWDNAAFLQGLHLSLSVGSVISPLIVNSFQQPKEMEAFNGTNRRNISSHNLDEYDIINGNARTPPETTTSNGTQFITNGIKESMEFQLIWPFVINACLVLIFATLFFGLWLQSFKGQQHSPSKKKEQLDVSEDKKSKLTLILMIMAVTLIFSLGAFEATYGGLLIQFTHKYLHISRATSKMIGASFWAGMTTGRVMGLLISCLGRLTIQLSVHIVIGILAMSILSGLSTVHFSIVWISTILAGLTISTSVANSIMLAKRTLQLKNRGTSVLLFGLYGGMVLGPAASGQCLSSFGIGTFPFINLGITLLMGISFLLILLLRKIIGGNDRCLTEDECAEVQVSQKEGTLLPSTEKQSKV